MSLAPWLIDLLVCPHCRSAVKLKDDGSGLKCVSCRRLYRIEDDIPVMLVSEAVVEDSKP